MAFWLLLFFPANILLCMDTASSHSIPMLPNETDHLGLIAFKNQITHDPLDALGSWNSSRSFCEWQGVSCSHGRQRVTALKLNSMKLEGTISPSIANLTFLTTMDLGNNFFRSRIPQELTRLFHLRDLNLTQNLLEGEIPSNFSCLFQLRPISISI
ncbi:hypothetical protein ACLOJK_039484 [Asimina triloba]